MDYRQIDRPESNLKIKNTYLQVEVSSVYGEGESASEVLDHHHHDIYVANIICAVF